MQNIGPGVISIAGFDASGGAGVLADIKTFEALGVEACGVATCITYQNDVEFFGVKWLENEEIENQLKPLFSRFSFTYAKIGLVKDFSQLLYMVELLKNHNPKIKIIWDPILKASAGFDFHSEKDFSHIYDVLKMLYLVTPNLNETGIFNKELSPQEACKKASEHCNILLKGGHAEGTNATDFLYINGRENALIGDRISGVGKHGSGCVLSSAITACLSNGNDLISACEEAKSYITQFLQSTPNLLGTHNFSVKNQGPPAGRAGIFTH